jgi:hypothetical protein
LFTTCKVYVSVEPSGGVAELAVFVNTTVAVPVGVIEANAVSAFVVAPALFGVVWLSFAVFVIVPDEDVARTSTTMDSVVPDARAKPVSVGVQVDPQVTVPPAWQMFVPFGDVFTSSSVTASVALVAVAALDMVADVPLATAVRTVPFGMSGPVTG